MKNKVYESFDEAVADIRDGATIMMHSFVGPSGVAQNLILALRNRGVRNLTIISCNFGAKVVTGNKPGYKPHITPDILVANGQVKKAITGWTGVLPEQHYALSEAIRQGKVEIELVPQGLLPERIRAGAAGFGGFYSPVGIGTIFEEGKEKRIINGREYVLEMPLRADYAFVRAQKADKFGNLVYRFAQRSYNPVIAMAASISIAEVDEIVEVGELDPEHIVTPGCFIDCIVKVS